MPNKPKTLRPPWVPDRKPFQNLNENKNRKLYNTSKWRKFSKDFKERNPICVKCEAEGIIVASAVTDHIQRVNTGGDIYDEGNLQALCKKCHNSKSGRESHGYREEKTKKQR